MSNYEKYVKFKKLNNIEEYQYLKIRKEIWYPVLEIVKGSHISIIDDLDQLLVIYEYELVDAEIENKSIEEFNYEQYLGINPYQNKNNETNYSKKLKNEALEYAEQLIFNSYEKSAINVIDQLLLEDKLDDVQEIWNTIYKNN